MPVVQIGQIELISLLKIPIAATHDLDFGFLLKKTFPGVNLAELHTRPDFIQLTL